MIPDAIEFAGTPQPAPIPGGFLWKCETCGLLFRFPRLSKRHLDELYDAASQDNWATPVEERVDWALARETLLSKGGGGRVLDLGCFDGRFLRSLPAGWDLHGIEVNRAARQRASAAGVKVIGSDFADMTGWGESFDVITAFDVIEHVEDPVSLLERCAMTLKPGGLLLVATGDALSLPWRLLRSRNLYCIWPEHLSFVSQPWMQLASARTGFRLQVCVRYRRAAATPISIFGDVSKNILYRLCPWLIAGLRRRLSSVDHPVKYDYPLRWPTAKDHFFTTLIKNPS